MRILFIHGVSKYLNELRTPGYIEDDYLLIVIRQHEIWVKVTPFMFDQFYAWLQDIPT